MQTSGMFYATVVQAILLYGLETWIMSPWIGKALGGFHHRVVWRLTGWMPQRNFDGTWTYLPLGEEMAEVGVQEVETYATHRQNTVTQFIVTRPIMDLCLAAARRPGAQVSKRWWEQEGRDLEGIREAARAAEAERDLGGRAGEEAEGKTEN